MKSYLNKGISTPLAIGIILVLAVIVAGITLAYQYYYVLNQEPTKTSNTEIDQTSDWKTYTNVNYRFSIEYLIGTQIKELDKSISFIFADGQRQLNIEVVTGAQSDECYKTAWSADAQDISLGGITFKGIGCGLKCEPYDEVQYCAIRDGIAYKLFPKIIYKPDERNFVEQDNVLNQMLSTFKFTE
ncbi:MAG: hypothetical protein PHI53_02095 [Candidatus Pacebacteria bacterium]|nr:hypothetical protein [Candidatus Paceibacterota bacterium]